MKKKLQSLGFTSGHAHLLLVAVAIFSVLFVSKAGISLKALFVNADDQQVMLTYEEVKNQVEAENPSPSGTDTTLSPEDEKQLALLDRDLENGQVLGSSVGMDIVPVEQIFTDESLEQIKLNVINDNSKPAIQKYADQVTYVESQYSSLAILANLNSGDKSLIEQAQQQATTLVRAMGAVTVPSNLAKFQKYKIMYYMSLINIGDIWTGKKPETDLQAESQIMFSLTNKIESTKIELENQYGVKL